jgi:EAL and modified HD-GYP domain-containing signal transduction protein
MTDVQTEPKPLAPNVLLGRQPICRSNNRTMGYELLFRNSQANEAVIENPEQATAQVVVNAFMEIGLEKIVGSNLAFINVTRDFILGNHCKSLPKDRVVLEILENTVPDAELFKVLGDMHNTGYRFALDDFTFEESTKPLLPYVDYVKVDLRAIEREKLAAEISTIRRPNLKLVAEKVETFEEYEYCKKLGFHFFQGYFFCKPHIVQGGKVPVNRLSLCRLLAKLQDPEISMRELESIIGEDLSLSYKILRYINSAYVTLLRSVQSVGHAVRLVGTEHIRLLASMIMLTSIDEKPRELIYTSLIRAKMCEMLAARLGHKDREGFFTVGLFSALDAFLDRPMKEALEMLPLSDEIKNALLHHEGPLGDVLHYVLSYEQALDTMDLSRVQGETLRDAYLESIHWGNDLVDRLVG